MLNYIRLLLIRLLLPKGPIEMTALSDAVAALQTDLTNLATAVTSVQAYVANNPLAAELAAANTDAANAVTAISTAATSLSSAIAALNAAVAPAA